MPVPARTLSRRFAVVLTTASAVLLILAAVSLDVFYGRMLTADFDRGLEDTAQTFMALLDQESNDLDFDAEALPEVYFQGEERVFFRITHDGSVLAASTGFDGRGFDELTAGAGIRNIEVADGNARGVLHSFYPRYEVEEDSDPQPMLVEPSTGIDPQRKLAQIAIGRYTTRLNAVQQQLRLITLAIFAVTLIAAFFLVHWATRFGLTPLNELAARARKLGPESPRLLVPTNSVPGELRPFVEAIDDLIWRLDDAYQRQCEFNSNVAHELRTPVTELRVISDVAEKWPEDRQMGQELLQSIAEIAVNMQGIIERLLDLSRVDQISSRNEAIHLTDFLEKLITGIINGSGQPNRIDVHIPANTIILSDSLAIGVVLRNLIANALDYSPDDTPVRISAEPRNGNVDVTVSNRAPGLDEDDLDHVFDRFWRKDAARTSRRHAGLGLAIARSYAHALGLALIARLDGDNTVSFTLAGINSARSQPDATTP